jgi:hypothetical protein
MHIIVKKTASHAMFRPHYNSSLGKFYNTKDDYLGDLKKMKLEPYREIQKDAPKKYVMDKAGREMVHQAAAYERRKEVPGSRFTKALNEIGIAKKPKWLTDAESMVGGFKGDVNDQD